MVMEVGSTDRSLEPDEDINRETNEVTSRLDAIHNVLQKQSARDGQFDITQARQATHVRMIPTRLVLSSTGAATVTLTIGTRTYVFTFTATSLFYDVPFVQPIDRGVDIFATITGGGGAALTAFLIYKPE